MAGPELSVYQEVARDALLENDRYGLFDEMGVGKTPPAIAAACKTGERVLVTAPAYLLENWYREIRRWAPNSPICLANGERKDRQRQLESSKAQFILTPYHSWHSYPVLLKRRYGVHIFDEAHRLRGRNSKWTNAVYQLQNVGNRNRDTRFWFLTGTPIVRDGGDIYPFLHMMDREIFRSYWNFVNRWCETTVTPWSTEVGDVLDPEEFWPMILTWAMRRRQAEIPELADLEVVEFDHIVDLPPSVLQTMRTLKKQYVLAHPDMDGEQIFDSIGAVIHRLRVMTTLCPTQAKPKLEVLKELVGEELATERVVIYCWYRETVDAVRELCEKLKRPVHVITGDVRAAGRVAAVDAYDGHPRSIIIGTIAAMKEGLNLQAGHNCVFLEEAELPAENEQAIGRLKRRGQPHPVNVHRILAGKTIDTITHRNVNKRADSVRKAMLEYVYTP